jgi:hypothetical protein
MKKIIMVVLLCLVSFSAMANGFFSLSIGSNFGYGGILFNYQQPYYPHPYYSQPYYPQQYEWNNPYYNPYVTPQFRWATPPVVIYREYHYRNYWHRRHEYRRNCIIKFQTLKFDRFTGEDTFITHYIDRCRHDDRIR